MATRTAFLSKLFGLYCVIFGVAMLLHKQAMVSTVEDLIHEPPLVLVLGITILAAGIAVVLTHNRWSGGTAAVLVTVFGWLTLIKGAVMVFLTPDGMVSYFQAFNYAQNFYLFTAFTLIAGLYLTIAGFRTADSQKVT